jgi:hypothetical protein
MQMESNLQNGYIISMKGTGSAKTGRAGAVPSATTVERGRVRLGEGQNLLTNGGIMTHVQIALGEPTLENIRLGTFSEDNADGNLGGQFVVGSVGGHSGDRVVAKSRAEFRVQP